MNKTTRTTKNIVSLCLRDVSEYIMATLMSLWESDNFCLSIVSTARLPAEADTL